MGVRRAKLEDAAGLAALSVEVWLHTYCKGGIPPLYADYVLKTYNIASLSALIAQPGEHFILEEDETGIRGYLRWSEAAEPPLPSCPLSEIATLYVRAHHKGIGIGTALLEACLRDGRAMGLEAFFLTVNAENSPAISFYRAKGFDQIGEDYFCLGNRRYRNLVMVKAA